MNVIDRYREGEPVELCEGELLTPAGLAGDAARGVLVEHAMEVTVNTVPTMRVVCHSRSPGRFGGWAVSTPRASWEGLDDIEDIYVCDQGTRASVLLSCHHADFSRQGVETVPSCCTGNRVYNRYFTSDERPAKVKPIPWEAAWSSPRRERLRRIRLCTRRRRALTAAISCSGAP